MWKNDWSICHDRWSHEVDKLHSCSLQIGLHLMTFDQKGGGFGLAEAICEEGRIEP